jgi:hypothetical protein
VFAFASESELRTSPSDRLGDVEAMSNSTEGGTGRKDPNLQLVDVLATVSLQNNVDQKSDREPSYSECVQNSPSKDSALRCRSDGAFPLFSDSRQV